MSKQRKQSRHPLLIGRDPSVWHPDLVGRVPGYPRTADGHKRRREAARAHIQRINAEGRAGTRKGVPDGWAGRKKEVEKLRAEAQELSAKLIKDLIQRGLLEPPTTSDTEKACIALTTALAIALDPTGSQQDRHSAIRLVMDFTRPKPTNGLKLISASEWLADLTRPAA